MTFQLPEFDLEVSPEILAPKALLAMPDDEAEGFVVRQWLSLVDRIRAMDAVTLGFYQPLDSDLTAIAALTTTAFGRGLLTLANVGALRTLLALKAIAQIRVTDPNGAALTVGDGQADFRINVELNGKALTAVAAHVVTVASAGIVTIQIYNVTQGWDMLTTRLTIDANEHDSVSAAIPAVIDVSSSHNIVATADELRIDIDVAGTGAKGLIVDLTFG